ncbi:hypothetical protein BDW72DRAFT_197194 [Aspergillus terricola var. indicus]
MAAPIQQPFETTIPEPVSEWKLSGKNLVRPLRGAELLVQCSEHYCDGNFQLTVNSSIESPLTNAQLRRRHHAAWYRTRLIHPVIGVEFPALSHASYALHHTAREAEQWASRTCIVETNTTINDVHLARSREKASRISMTLVLDPIRGPRGCVLNMSHTLISVDIFLIMQEFIAQLARPDADAGIAGIFSPEAETMHAIIPRLPQSLGHVYSHPHTGGASQHQPTPQDLQDALDTYQRAQDRWTRSSIGIPLHPDHATRRRAIQNKTISFEPAESRAAFKFLKQAGVSLTAAFFASMTAAIAQRYHAPTSTSASASASGSQDEDFELEPEGAHLLFSAHGRRWLDTSAANGRGPVTMPIIPSSAWVSAKDVNLRPRSQRGLLKLAAAIDVAQNEDIASPDIIPVFDQLAPELVAALANAHNPPSSPPPPPGRGRPTLTSQGQFSNSRDRHRAMGLHGDEAGTVRMTDFNTGGRTTDPTVCFALNSFRDQLRFNMLFDEKFFDVTEVMLLGHEVAGMFRRLVGLDMEQQWSVRAKL